MNAKTTIRKILFIAVWLTIGSGMLTLLVAAIGKKKREQCSGYRISIQAERNNLFVDEKDVQQLLVKAAGGNITGQPLSSFDLHQLEQSLEKNTWIKDAELYFDNQDVLHVTITERAPVARVFTIGGNTFYIDNTCRQLPLSDKISARVPVFTGFPGKGLLTRPDSVLLNSIRAMSEFILDDPFWMSQVAQIDITPSRNFEMIPVVGNHVVRLGNGENMDKKFNRLLVFYRQVLSKTGFDHYRSIDVQYKGQVVAAREDAALKVDSVQLRKNVEKLLAEAPKTENPPAIISIPLTEEPIMPDSVTGSGPATEKGKKPTGPNPVKTISKPTEEKPVVKEEEKKVPKAVMPKRNG